MTSFSAVVPPGESRSFEKNVSGQFRLIIHGDETPYEVDIEEKHRNNDDSSYHRIDPLVRYGTLTIRTSEEYDYETGEVPENGGVRVTVTNNSGDSTSVRGRLLDDGRDVFFMEGGRRYGDHAYFGSVAIVGPRTPGGVLTAADHLLEDLGAGATVWVTPDAFTRTNGKAATGTLRSHGENQRVDFFDSTVELADDASVTEMVHVRHDGFKIADVNLDGNRANTTVSRAITAGSVSDLRIDEVEVAEVPTGAELDGVTEAIVTGLRSREGVANVDIPLVVRAGNEVEVEQVVIPSYNSKGLLVEDTTGIIVNALAVNSADATDAEAAVHLRGLDSSRVSGLIDGDGNVTVGVLDEPYDPGAPDQKVSSGNRVDMDVNGAQQYGVRISDCEVERLDININGEYDGGRTTVGWVFDTPYGIVDNPAHQADLDVQGCTRWSDTAIDSQNAGATVRGHVTKIQDTCDYQLNGRSVTDVTFGVALPRPVANVGANTTVQYNQSARRTSTDSNGRVEVDWSDYYHFTDKPLLNVSLEGVGRQWYVHAYSTDSEGRYTGATVQVTDSSGTAVGTNVPVNLTVVGT